MLLDTTYYNKDHKDIINGLVGKPFSFLKKIKMKGIGSSRMVVDRVSPNLQMVMNQISDDNYANIELRPKGILVLINKGLQNLTWIIPYYRLVIYKVNGSSLHAEGKYIHFKMDKKFSENKAFFDKLLNEKTKYDINHPMPFEIDESFDAKYSKLS